MTPQEKSWKERLYQAEADYPADMWDRIAMNLPPQKTKSKRRFLPILFFTFSLIIIISGIYYFSDYSVTEEATERMSSAIISADNALPSKSMSIPKDNEKEITNFSINNSEQDTPNFTNQNDNTSAYKNILKNNSNNENPTNKAINNSEIKSNAELKALSNISISEVSGMNINEDENDIETSNKKLLRSKEHRPLINPISNLPSLKYLPDQYFYDFPTPECPSFYNDQAGLYFDFYFSHEYGFRDLNPKNPALQGYASQRDSTESGLYSFSTGTRISFILPSGWGVKSGINYSQINEKFSFKDPDDFMTETVIVIDTVLVNGIPTAVSDTTTTTIPGTTEITTYNKYRFIDIPLLVTYEAPISDRWYFNVNGGVLLNLAFSQKGRFLDEAGNPVWFTSSRADRVDAYKMSVGMSFYGSLALHYVWNDHFDLFVEPNFRYYTGSLTTEEYGLNQKYLTTGLMTGVRYKF